MNNSKKPDQSDHFVTNSDDKDIKDNLYDRNDVLSNLEATIKMNKTLNTQIIKINETVKVTLPTMLKIAI